MKKFLSENKWIVFFLLGAANALPFTFDFLFFISWFSFAPFFVLSVKGERTSLFSIFSFLFGFHFGIYHFFLALVPMDFIGLGFLPSLLLMLASWMGLSALHSIVIALPMYLALRARVGKALKIVVLGLLFVLMQYVLSLGTYGFTWSRLSLPQSAMTELMQSASLFGPYFVDLILMSVNAFLAISYYSKKRWHWVFLSVAVFFANYLYGFIYSYKNFPADKTVNVNIIQGNVLTDSKWDGRSSYSVYLDSTLALDATDSLVVWAETAIPTQLNTSRLITNQLEAYTELSGNEMIVGAFFESDVGRQLNAAYYINNGKISENVYFKRRLVPFGEFLPMRKLLGGLSVLDNINLISSDLTAGNSASVTETENGKVGCLICFDSIFSALARDSVREGAELLVVITNDSWYKDFPAVYQHNNQSKWRAVENGRWVVRAANSGISSIISPHGKTVSSLPPLVRDTLSGEVSFISETTLYTRVGDVVLIPIILFIIFYIIIIIIFKKPPHKSEGR